MQSPTVTAQQVDNALADLADFIHLRSRHATSGVCHGDNDGCEGGPDEADLAAAEQAWETLKGDLHLREAHGPADAGTGELARQLRTHAFEVPDRSVSAELRRMADTVDGGTGLGAHHGCPDVTIRSADCTECALVLDAEVAGGARRSIFSTDA